MAIKTSEYLLTRFQQTDEPDEQDFADLIESCRLKSEPLQIVDLTYGVNEIVAAPNTVVDVENGGNVHIVLDQNITLDIQNLLVGQYLNIAFTQDATGGRTVTLPAGVKVANAGGGTILLTNTPNATDVFSFYRLSDTVILCNETLNYT